MTPRPAARPHARWPVIVGALVMVATGAARAQDPDGLDAFNGTWRLAFDGRSVPRADLLASVTPATLAATARLDLRAVRWCNPLGMPFVMEDAGAIEIRVGPRWVVLAAEADLAPVRYLYRNRDTHIDPEIYDPTTNGDSIARWDGDALVVDTIGFSDEKGMRSIPGGGFRTSTTHLTERFRLLGDGDVLSVTFTWEDPNVFRTPHTYELRYRRLPSTYQFSAPPACDAFDAERTAFLERVAGSLE
jgi:hypothetical protein